MTAPLLADEPLGVINVGVEAFAQSVRDTGGTAVHLDWRPVGDGDPRLAWALAELVSDSEESDAAGARIDRANASAVSRMRRTTSSTASGPSRAIRSRSDSPST